MHISSTNSLASGSDSSLDTLDSQIAHEDSCSEEPTHPASFQIGEGCDIVDHHHELCQEQQKTGYRNDSEKREILELTTVQMEVRLLKGSVYN